MTLKSTPSARRYNETNEKNKIKNARGHFRNAYTRARASRFTVQSVSDSMRTFLNVVKMNCFRRFSN